MDIIDLRSDTVSHPTPAMREAMAKAKVGDDVYGDDPTINRLQEIAADMLGKSAGLFVTSGTMGNLAAILAHCGRGDEAILGDKSHTFLFEAGGVSALGGVHSLQLPNQPDGTMLLGDIEGAVRNEDDVHQPITRLISIENTHNRSGGVPLSLEYTEQVGDIARQHDLALHIDGARIFHAAIAWNMSARELVAAADSVTFCLSKALCAPVGSVLCGSKEFIKQAHRIRKQLGGGMRQAGILAAAGIVALESMVERLAEDHSRARLLAEGLAGVPGIVLDPGTPATNMVFCSLSEDVPVSASEVAASLKNLGVLVGAVGARRFRLVPHYWIDDSDVSQAVQAFGEVILQADQVASISPS